MITSRKALGLALLSGLVIGMPALAHASSHGHGSNVAAPVSGPTPRQQLDQVASEVRQGRIDRAATDLMVLQNRLINDSIAWNLPADQDASSLRAAVQPLDKARAALARGDTTAALAAIDAARDVL